MNGALMWSLQIEQWAEKKSVMFSFQPIKYLNFHIRLNVQCAMHLRYCCSIRIRKRYIYFIHHPKCFVRIRMWVGNVLAAFAVDVSILINKFMTFTLLRIDVSYRKWFPASAHFKQTPAIHTDASSIERSLHFVSTNVHWWIATNANAVVVAWQKAPWEIKFSQSYAFEQNVLLVSNV